MKEHFMFDTIAFTDEIDTMKAMVSVDYAGKGPNRTHGGVPN